MASPEPRPLGTMVVARTLGREPARHLVHDGEALATLRAFLAERADDFITTQITSALASVHDRCALAYLQRCLAPLPDRLAIAVIDALTGEHGPFALARPHELRRRDLYVWTTPNGEVTIVTPEDEVTLPARAAFALLELPDPVAMSEVGDRTARALRAAGASDTAAADALVEQFLRLGLLAAHDAATFLRSDPRRLLYVRGALDVDTADAAAAMVAPDDLYKGVIRVVTPLPRTGDDARALLARLVQLRNHRFDDASWLVEVDEAGAIDAAAIAALRQARESLEIPIEVAIGAGADLEASDALARALATGLVLRLEHPDQLAEVPADRLPSTVRIVVPAPAIAAWDPLPAHRAHVLGNILAHARCALGPTSTLRMDACTSAGFDLGAGLTEFSTLLPDEIDDVPIRAWRRRSCL